MVSTLFALGCVLGFALMGARQGVKSVLVTTLASALSLLGATALTPVLAKGLAGALNPLGVWTLGSFLVFALLYFALSRVLNLFIEPLKLPLWLNKPGGALVLALVGALVAGLLLWTWRFAEGVQRIVRQESLNPPQGVMALACLEVESLVHLSARLSYLPPVESALLATLAADPALFMARVLNLTQSPELQGLWADRDAQLLLTAGNLAGVQTLPSFAAFANNPSAKALLTQIAAAGYVNPQELLARQLAKIWQAKQALADDPEIAAMLAGGEIYALIQQGDTLGLLMHPDTRRLLAAIGVKLRTQPKITELMYSWQQEDGAVQISPWRDIPEKFRASANPVKDPSAQSVNP